MTRCVHFDPLSGDILNWMDTVAFSYSEMPPNNQILNVTDKQWNERESQRFMVKDSKIVPYVEPVIEEPTDSQKAILAFESIKSALQAAIDAKAKEFEFSSGNSLMLYANYDNPFKVIALPFAQWEASVWAEAGAYKTEVFAGTKAIVTPEDAVAMMPELVI